MKNFLIILLFALAGLAQATEKSEQPYVLLISFDGFRHDYLDRGLTPNIDRFYEQGVRASSLRPSFPSKTFPNHYTLVTGMYPESHNLIANGFTNTGTGEVYRLGDTVSVRQAKWYGGEPLWTTAERQGVISASYFWVGSEVDVRYRYPTYRYYYDHSRPYMDRVEQVIDWLELPEAERPHFITLYFHETDSKGHRYGPTAVETDSAIALLDRVFGKLVNGLKNTGMYDKTNIIIVSDHGMTDVSPERVINVEALLGDLKCEMSGSGPLMMIDDENALQRLKNAETHFRVYRREEVPGHYHFSKNPNILPLVLIAEPGWALIRNSDLQRKHYSKGDHGYDNSFIDMHGVFVAAGPGFKSGYRTGSLRNIDVYPLVCKLLGIMPAAGIDGSLDEIGHVLR
jgi:ectonucleotide pyrophosphatase/phosphodiesterase family protein 5